MSDTERELVAKAIWEANEGPFPWEDMLPGMTHNRYLRMAAAAVAALDEARRADLPTDEQSAASLQVPGSGGRYTRGDML